MAFLPHIRKSLIYHVDIYEAYGNDISLDIWLTSISRHKTANKLVKLRAKHLVKHIYPQVQNELEYGKKET